MTDLEYIKQDLTWYKSLLKDTTYGKFKEELNIRIKHLESIEKKVEEYDLLKSKFSRYQIVANYGGNCLYELNFKLIKDEEMIKLGGLIND